MRKLIAAVLFFGLMTAGLPAFGQQITKSHGQALFGQLKYPEGFTHFDYVNPGAPKGGTLVLSAIGTFDSFNPYIIKGNAAAGISFLYETLMSGSLDEIDTSAEYGLLAESVETPDDLSWVIYNIRPEARWHDGKPVTADDVVFSFETLTTKAHPFYRAYYQNVTKAEKLDTRRVRFSFNTTNNRELPHIMGQIPVLPKHFFETVSFEESSLVPPIGSGPYRIKQFEAGRTITFERVEDYWGKDVAVNIGHNNFNEIRYDYYRDTTVSLEAFKAHEYDYRAENSAKNWATAYDAPAVNEGLIIKEERPDRSSQGMQAFVLNVRRPIFSDVRVRQAINLAFDFEWANRNLFYGQYTRTTSYFQGTGMEARGLPGGLELAYLEPHRAALPKELFTEEFVVPSTDGAGENRNNLRQATRILRDAGWRIEGGALTKDGLKLEFEVLLVQPDFERIVQPFRANLEKLGIAVRIRTIDTSQYINRLRDFDFDMVVGSFAQSFSPGNEQRDFWGAERAQAKGSRNIIGVSNPVIDDLIDKIIEAPDREHLVAATRALDRVMLWNYYVVPQWHVATFRIAYWDKFGQPETRPKFGVPILTWWVDAEKERRLAEQDTERQ